jgi:ribosomal subunit interface protein
MQTPLQITFRSTPRSEALADHITARSEKLEALTDKIVSCHVVVELTAQHQRHGAHFHVSVHVGVPGHEVVVNHAPRADKSLETAVASTDRAFDEAERQLESWVGRQRGHRHGDAHA